MAAVVTGGTLLLTGVTVSGQDVLDVGALEAACHENAADQAALDACLDVVRSTLSVRPTEPPEREYTGAARAYFDFAEQSNARADENDATNLALLDRTDLLSDERTAGYPPLIELFEWEVQEVLAIDFPDDVRPLVDDWVDVRVERIGLLREAMEGDRGFANGAALYDNHLQMRSTSNDLRAALGLPMLEEQEENPEEFDVSVEIVYQTPPPTPEPTPTPAPTPIPRAQVGDWATVHDFDGEPEFRVKVVEVRQDPFFQMSVGRNVPEDGGIWISAFLRYEALQNGVFYSPLDWQVFVGDEAYGDWSAWIGAPEPGLDTGTLPRGRKVSGWVTFSVPKRGEVTMAYEDLGDGPPFEFVLRED